MRVRRPRGARPRWIEQPVVSDFATDAELAEWEESGDVIKAAMTSLRRYHISLLVAFHDPDAPADHSAGYPRLGREPDGTFAPPEGGPPASLVAAVLLRKRPSGRRSRLTGHPVPPPQIGVDLGADNVLRQTNGSTHWTFRICVHILRRWGDGTGRLAHRS